MIRRGLVVGRKGTRVLIRTWPLFFDFARMVADDAVKGAEIVKGAETRALVPVCQGWIHDDYAEKWPRIVPNRDSRPIKVERYCPRRQW